MDSDRLLPEEQLQAKISMVLLASCNFVVVLGAMFVFYSALSWKYLL